MKTFCLILLTLITIGSVKAIEPLPERFQLCQTPRGRFITRVNDQHVGWVLSQGRHWEEHLVSTCLKHIRPGSLVVDVGANLGTHTIPWARKAQSVYAFEPQRLVFQQLCANCLLNDLQNVQCLQIALGHANQAAHLDATIPAVSGFSPDRTLSYEQTDRLLNFGGVRLGNDGEEVEMRTLDSYRLSNVSLIKVDVEGADPLVFYGARETICVNKPVIVYEKRKDRPVTSSMVQSLGIGPEVAGFDIEAFVNKELPGVYASPQAIGKDGDYILVPNKEPVIEGTVLLAILARNKEHTLPYYLKCIESLDYDKQLITVYIDTNNNSDHTQEILEAWRSKNAHLYHKILMNTHHISELKETLPHEWTQERFKFLGQIRNKSMQHAQMENCAHYFVVDCDNFIAPCTLKELIRQDKPIIAPMLRSIPDSTDPYSNFFCDITEVGYCKSHPNYFPILLKTMRGTFEVPVVHCTYLVRTDCIPCLTYSDGSYDHEFVIFSRSARNNRIAQYICNEKEFGVLLHFNDTNMSLEMEEEQFHHFLTWQEQLSSLTHLTQKIN